jgi:hypothetical protein
VRRRPEQGKGRQHQIPGVDRADARRVDPLEYRRSEREKRGVDREAAAGKQRRQPGIEQVRQRQGKYAIIGAQMFNPPTADAV